MSNLPLCAFGPGGEYRRYWPENAAALPVEPALPTAAEEARKDGLQAPLVSLGPDGIHWVKKPQPANPTLRHSSGSRVAIRP